MSNQAGRRGVLFLLAVGALSLGSASSAAAGELLRDDARGFSLKLPDGFAPIETLAHAAPKIIHGFLLGDPEDDELDIMLFIEKMSGTIGRTPITRQHLPPDFRGRIQGLKWQGFDVQAVEVPEELGELKTITYNVQIPLQRAAIQLKLFGPLDRQAEMKLLLPQIVAGLEGKSSWNAAPPISEDNYRNLLIGFSIFYFAGGLIVMLVISRKSPPGTLLSLSAIIYCASWMMDGSGVREMMVFVGVTRMLGFAGGLLGAIDLFRHRRRARKAARETAERQD